MRGFMLGMATKSFVVAFTILIAGSVSWELQLLLGIFWLVLALLVGGEDDGS